EHAKSFISEALRQIVVEAESKSIRSKPGWPIRQPTVHAVDRHDASASCRFALDRPKISRVQPAFAGDGALFPGRQPLDLPDRQPGIRQRERCPPEDATQDTRQPLRAIEGTDVCDPGRKNKPQPVVGPAYKIG